LIETVNLAVLVKFVSRLGTGLRWKRTRPWTGSGRASRSNVRLRWQPEMAGWR
jgi:hypothetical protein